MPDLRKQLGFTTAGSFLGDDDEIVGVIASIAALKLYLLYRPRG